MKMDMLSTLSYTTFNDFYISIKKIRYGWMSFNVVADNKDISYDASYLCDPLNDLLDVAVLFAGGPKGKAASYYPKLNYIGNYFYVTHELEGDSVIWLFKYVGEELTLIIWNGFPVDMDALYDLAVADFDDQSLPFTEQDLTQKLVFAMKGSLLTFAKTLIDTFHNLECLQRWEDDDDEWGFAYSKNQLDFFLKWVYKNSALIN